MGEIANYTARKRTRMHNHLDIQADNSYRVSANCGSWNVCDQFLCNKGMKTLREIPELMDDYMFQKELKRIREHLDAISEDSNTVEVRRNYLISWVTIPSAPIYTPDQLRQIFNLTWE